MSVINQVLRDLQRREPGLRLVQPEVLRDAGGRDSDRRGSIVRGGFAVLLPMVGLLLALWWRQPDSGTAIPVARQEPAPLSRPQAPTQPPLVAAAEMEPAARLQGLQLERGPRSLSLRFQLSATAISYLQRQSGDSYRFVLKDLHSEIEAPALDGNPMIRHLELQAHDGDLRITLETAPGVDVETATRARPDGGQDWILALRKPLEPESVSQDGMNGIEAKTKATATDEKPHPAASRPKPTAAPKAAAATAPEQVIAADTAPPQLDIRPSAAGPAPSPALERRRQAHALFRAGMYADLLRRFADDPQQDDLLALAWQRLGRHEQAVTRYRRLLQREPAVARHWIGLGLSLEQLQRPAEARAAYARARDLGGLSERLEAFVEERLRPSTLDSASATGGQ